MNLEGKIIDSVKHDIGSIRINFQDGSFLRGVVDGDCCSYSWIEYCLVPGNVEGARVLSKAFAHGKPVEHPMETPECDHKEFYSEYLATSAGHIVVEYRNESNGYYGGYMILELQETKND